MKKKILAVFLSLCMAMSLLPVTALATEAADEETPSAQATTLPEAVNGVITLTENVNLKQGVSIVNNDLVIDLNGYTITYTGTPTQATAFFNVGASRSLTVRDSKGNGAIIVNEDYCRDENNADTSYTVRCVQVRAGGTFTLESGTLQNTNTASEATAVIINFGTVNINGGAVKGVTGIINNAPVLANAEWADRVSTCNINGGLIEGTECKSYISNGIWKSVTDGDGWSWGVALFGPGFGKDGNQEITYDKVALNMSDGTIRAGQGIGTNASSGRYAGNTITINGGTIEGVGNGGAAMYLPAIGKTTINSGTIQGEQGIRICAGELTINGGTINGTALSDGTDLTAGGSGGTKGALVIGKASTGYIGDIIVSINAGAKVQNTASGETGKSAIVVSDKNMALDTDQTINNTSGDAVPDKTFSYSKTAISVNIDGATINGDVVKASNLTPGDTKDGGNTSLVIENATVNGDVSNQSKTGLTVKDSIITGKVTNTSEGNTALLNTDVQGGVEDDKDGTGTIFNDKEVGKTVALNQSTSKSYTDLATALSEAEDGQTIVLVADITDITLTGTSGYTQAFNINKSITLDGQNHKITVKEKTGGGHVHVLGINADNVTVKNLTIDGGDESRSGISVYRAEGVKLENVTSENNTASGVVVNNSEVTADGLKTANNGWHGVNVDPKDGDRASIVLTNADIRDANGVQVDNGTSGHIAAVTIESGYVSKVTNKTSDGTSTITVNGGSFGTSVKDYVADNLKAELNHDGTYTYYESVEAALKDAQSGDKITSLEGSSGETQEAIQVVKVTYVNGSKTTSETVLAGEIMLPEVNDQGYNHFVGWNDGSKTHDAGAQVTISKDTTFTAVWTYIPPANPNYRIDIPAAEGGTVTADPAAAKAGATVTLTATPDEGYAVGTLTVTDRFGDAVKVTENADGTYTFTMPNGQVTVKATFVETEEPAPAEPFPDVDENDWFYDEVVYVYENGLMNGVENNQFAPNTATNRAMLATILYRLAGEPAVSGDLPFTDVAAGTWYTDAVLWAAQNGIVNGLGENTFAPMNTLTREQLVTMLYRYAEAEGYDVSAAADLSGYPDAGKVQTYAQEAMSWAVAEGIVEGMDGNLNPAGSATRAQIATILMRFCEGVAK